MDKTSQHPKGRSGKNVDHIREYLHITEVTEVMELENVIPVPAVTSWKQEGHGTSTPHLTEIRYMVAGSYFGKGPGYR